MWTGLQEALIGKDCESCQQKADVGTTIPQSSVCGYNYPTVCLWDNNNPENDGASHKGTVHHPESSSTCVRLGLLLQKGGGNEHAGKMKKQKRAGSHDYTGSCE